MYLSRFKTLVETASLPWSRSCTVFAFATSIPREFPILPSACTVQRPTLPSDVPWFTCLAQRRRSAGESLAGSPVHACGGGSSASAKPPARAATFSRLSPLFGYEASLPALGTDDSRLRFCQTPARIDCALFSFRIVMGGREICYCRLPVL